MLTVGDISGRESFEGVNAPVGGSDGPNDRCSSLVKGPQFDDGDDGSYDVGELGIVFSADWRYTRWNHAIFI